MIVHVTIVKKGRSEIKMLIIVRELEQSLACLNEKILESLCAVVKIPTSKTFAKGVDSLFWSTSFVFEKTKFKAFLMNQPPYIRGLFPVVFLLITLEYFKNVDFLFLNRLPLIKSPSIFMLAQGINLLLRFTTINILSYWFFYSIAVSCGYADYNWYSSYLSRKSVENILSEDFSEKVLVASLLIRAKLLESDMAKNHIRVWGKLLYPVSDYFSPAMVEQMDILEQEFSYSDMTLCPDSNISQSMLIFLPHLAKLKTEKKFDFPGASKKAAVTFSSILLFDLVCRTPLKYPIRLAQISSFFLVLKENMSKFNFKKFNKKDRHLSKVVASLNSKDKTFFRSLN